MTITIECSKCGAFCKVSKNATGVICSDCVLDMLIDLDQKTTVKKKVGYPKGWRFMKVFVHADGTVYYRGVEQPELKGKLEPTQIVEKPKKTKKQKQEEKMSLIDEYASLKKKLKGEKRKTVRKKIELRLNKLSKLL